MSKIRRTIKVIFILLISICIILSITSGFVIAEGKKTQDKIDEFVNRSQYVGTYKNNNSNQTIAYYKVIKEKDYEKSDERKIFHEDTLLSQLESIFVGDVGDVYISSNNSIGLIYTEWMSKKIKIGHCGMIINENATETIEIVGNKSKEQNVVKVYENTWLLNDYPDFIIMRTKEYINKKEIIENIESVKNKQYNYFYFMQSKDKYYCTDLISRILNESGVTITDKKSFITGSDFINSDVMYPIYYKVKSSENGIDYNVYYLSEE